MITNSRCPVCGAVFYRKAGTRQKYDKALCKKTRNRVTYLENRVTVRLQQVSPLVVSDSVI